MRFPFRRRQETPASEPQWVEHAGKSLDTLLREPEWTPRNRAERRLVMVAQRRIDRQTRRARLRYEERY